MSRADTAYSLYGLAVESPVPLACPRAATGMPDVRLAAASSSFFAHLRRTLGLSASPRDWFECRASSDDGTYLRWAGLFEFLIEPGGRCVRFRRLRRASADSFETYLLGQVLSFSLLALGYEPLHATAVVIDGEAVAFLGDCGYGKSTLGAALLARGLPLLTDDLLVIERRQSTWIARPGPPRLKLFPSTAKKLLNGAHGCLQNPGTSKIIVRLRGAEAAVHAVPLGAIYVLPQPARRARSTDRVSIRTLPPAEGFLALARAAFNVIRVTRPRLENHFWIATQLARDCPLRQLTYPRRMSTLDAVCDAVLADVARRKRRASEPTPAALQR